MSSPFASHVLRLLRDYRKTRNTGWVVLKDATNDALSISVTPFAYSDDMANSTEWQNDGMRATLELLAENDRPMRRLAIADALRSRFTPEGDDLTVVSNGSERWWNYIAWGTSGLTAAGWLFKDKGDWSITEEGRAALVRYPVGKDLRTAANQLYALRREALAESSVRRAWLVRGSSVIGVNMVSQWLEDGWCSLAASQLPPVAPGLSQEGLTELDTPGAQLVKRLVGFL
jgi:hypothetical protein